MRLTHQRTRSFMLVELMWVIFLSAIFLAIIGKLMFDAFYLLRVAGEHSDRMAAMDALTTRIRTDALAATSYEWDGRALWLTMPADGAAGEVCYVVDADRVLRTEDGRRTHGWHVFRLRFAGDGRRGTRYDVFELRFIEEPPERAGRLPDRAFALSVLLPHDVGGTATKPGGKSR